MNDTKLVVKLDLAKVLTEHLFLGKNGAKYLDIVLIPSKNSKFGDSHFAIQELPRAMRDAGQKGPIIGNAKILGQKTAAPAAPQRYTDHKTPPAEVAAEDIPW